jgi:hypothetical protein
VNPAGEGDMRRKDKEIPDKKDIEEIIKNVH